MTYDEAVRKFDLSQLTGIQLVVLEAAIAALIKNHPKPAAIRRDFDWFYSKMLVAAAGTVPGDEPAMSVVAAHLRNQLFSGNAGATDKT